MEAKRHVIAIEQRKQFPEILAYFDQPKASLKDIPNLVTQLNVYQDKFGILRVRCKFRKWFGKNEFPVLLPQKSRLTELIVSDAHLKLSHSGCYSVLAELRRKFYIPKQFSTVKKIIKNCIHCRRFHNNTFKLNQEFLQGFQI